MVIGGSSSPLLQTPLAFVGYRIGYPGSMMVDTSNLYVMTAAGLWVPFTFESLLGQIADNAGAIWGILGAASGSVTLAGAKSFSGQVELLGQSATNGTSAMSRALGDSRWALLRSSVTSNVIVTNSTTFVNGCAVTLPVGNYRVRSVAITLNSSTTGQVKSRLNFTGTATATPPITVRGYNSAPDGASFGLLMMPQSNYVHSYTWESDNFSTLRSMYVAMEFEINVTVAGVLSSQFAMVIASGSGDAATMVPGSFIEALRTS